jgi:5-methylcytosine-specific restriction endonuclease McrA
MIGATRRQRLIKQLTEQQGGKCCYCNVQVENGSKLSLAFLMGFIESPWSDKVATLEHKFPRARGGTDDMGNLAVSCIKCNREKRDIYTHDEFLALKQAEAK